MGDVSSNDNIDLEEVIEDVSSNGETSDQDGFEPNYQSGEDYIEHIQSEIRSENLGDYSANFANIENLFKFQIAIIIGFLLVVCFVIGWKHD